MALAQFFISLDLRFSRKEDEADFKKSLELEILRSYSLGVTLFMGCGSVGVLQNYIKESSRDDGPFQWSLADPRIVLYLIQAFHIASALAVVVTFCFLQKRVRLLKCASIELVLAILAACYAIDLQFVSMWTLASLWGRNPDKVWVANPRSGDSTVLIGTITVVSGTCSFIPIRFCVLWIVPVCAWSAYSALALCVGLPFPEKLLFNVFVLGALCFTSLFGAWQRERNVRERWRAEVVVQEQLAEIRERTAFANAMEALLHVTCDFVVQLTVDLRISESSVGCACFFGRDLEGLPLTEVLVGDDKKRLETAATHASSTHAPSLIHATLQRHLGTCEAVLIVVDASQRQLHYLIGIRIESEEEPLSGSAVRPDLLRNFAPRRSAPSTVLQGNIISEASRATSAPPSNITTTRQTGELVHPTELGRGDLMLL